MKIAQISPLYESVPPRLYGGTERVVAHLCDALVEAGHEVTLFAAGDADTRAELAPMRERAIRLDDSAFKSNTANLAAHLSMMHEVRRRAGEFDLLHFHVDLLHFPFFEDLADRTLTTLHGRLDHKDMAPAYKRWSRYPLASISNHQRRPLPLARWLGTVYHGLPTEQFPFVAEPAGGYLAFLGRISPEKRADRAIEIARRAGLPLKIAAKVDDADRDYFHEVIEPMLAAPGVEFLGEVGEAQKAELLGNAQALLFPIDWPEPFGLVMIEAMACGTPVIGWNCGSVPEVLDEGVTGAVVDSIDAAVAAVADLRALDRARVRTVFERRFSAAAMAHDYLDLYARLAGRGGRALQLSA